MAVAGNDRRKGFAFDMKEDPFLHYRPKTSWPRPEEGQGQSPNFLIKGPLPLS
ncbi:hypothetical protein BOA8489_00893 [Boseongicola aestuarii]|uniref:Uncharacterized protein n=1 Tax=Boseongicola aestuarii TaxID=1470561 RepID=A0A238IY57_9RHOB|nr:hypothetical protein BOA8489_00893 [Boseongicola aestuarii]